MYNNISKYMDIHRIEFMVTYQCSGKCKHCSIGNKLNHANSSKHVQSKQAEAAIKTLSELFDITSIMTFGGEPLLYPDIACAIHKQAKACHIEQRQLITNGFFTKSDDKRMQVAKALAQAGVNNLLLSVDAFHQETIPLDAVCAFAKDIKDTNIPNVKLHPAWVVDESHENIYNAETKHILAKLSYLNIPISNGNNIFMAGNATTHLAAYYDRPHVNLADTCGVLPYTEPLTSITSLSVVPNGDVMACGFVIGNIYDEDIEAIVSRYNPYENACMHAVVTGGASALLAYAKQKGIYVDIAACYSVCDICNQVANASYVANSKS